MVETLLSFTLDSLNSALSAPVLKSQKSSNNQTWEISKRGTSAFYWSICLSNETW